MTFVPVPRKAMPPCGASRVPPAALPPLVLLLATVLGGCIAAGVTEDVDEAATRDARVAADVKRALITADDVDAAAVRVVVTDDGVTLDGFVASEEERRAALAAARTAAGELEVSDAMELRR